MPEPASARSVRCDAYLVGNETCSRTAGRDAEPADRLAQRQLGRRGAEQVLDQPGRSQRPRQHAGRQHTGDPAVHRHRELGCLGGLGEGVDELDGRLRLGVHQVEGLAVEAGLVRDVVHRLGDVVDGYDVGVAHVDAQDRHPLRQVVAQPLEEREEVVGTVDLVHLAGLGVPHHDGRPVDPPGDRATPRGRCARSRTSSGGTTRAAPAPRRTSSRRRRRGSHPDAAIEETWWNTPASSSSASSSAARVPPTFSCSLSSSEAVMS